MAMRVLAAVDGSSYSEATIRVAVDLCVQLGAELTTLNVVNVTSRSSGNLFRDIVSRFGFEPAHVDPAVEQAHLQRGRRVLNRAAAAARAAGVPVVERLAQGAVHEEIHAAALHTDLMVMGLRGTTEDSVTGRGGSTLHEVSHSENPPLLVVPRTLERVQSLALGYDGSEGAAHVLSCLRMWMRAGFRPVVHAMFVGTGQDPLGEVEDQLPDLTVHLHRLPDAGEPVHKLLADNAIALGADVLALGFRGDRPLKDFLYGSAADHLIKAGTIGLLIAH